MKMKRTKTGAARKFAGRHSRLGLMALAFSLAGQGVAATAQTATAVKSPGKATAKRSWFQIGKASWYGGKFNGRRTATGEKFDMSALTCAHRTLPLGSWVRITNLHNKRSAFLRVNDRGPVSENLIVDLSLGAARSLGISGLGNVKIEPVTRRDMLQTRAAAAPRITFELASTSVTSSGVPILPAFIADR